MKYPKAQLTHKVQMENEKVVKDYYTMIVGETDTSCGYILYSLTKEELLAIRDEIDKQLIK